jgi:hypothetical protein
VSRFSENLSYLYQLRGFASAEVFGKVVGIDRSGVSRLLSGARAPTANQKMRIARYFELRAVDFDLTKDEFLEVAENVVTKSNLVFLAFRTIRQNLPRFEDVAHRYEGQYLVYYPQSRDGSVIASLLSIGKSTKEGIAVRLINPHRDSSGTVTAYEYAGYMYPIREFLYFYFEQKPADYEILSIILHESRAPQVNVLRGMISGVGVLDDLSFIAARPIVVQRRRRNIENWESALGNELGYIPSGRVPEIARKHLSEERITVRAVETSTDDERMG